VSAAAAEVAGAETVSWELGARCSDDDAGAADDAIAVELGVPALSAAQVQARARRARAHLSLPARHRPLAVLRWPPAVLSLLRMQLSEGVERKGVRVCGAARHGCRWASGRAAAPAARSPPWRRSRREGRGPAPAERSRRRSERCTTSRACARRPSSRAAARTRAARPPRPSRAANPHLPLTLRHCTRAHAQAINARCNEVFRAARPVRAAAVPPGADHGLLYSPLLRGALPRPGKVRPARAARRAMGCTLLAVPASQRTWNGAEDSHECQMASVYPA